MIFFSSTSEGKRISQDIMILLLKDRKEGNSFDVPSSEQTCLQPTMHF